jgi:hypothetical protein
MNASHIAIFIFMIRSLSGGISKWLGPTAAHARALRQHTGVVASKRPIQALAVSARNGLSFLE